MAKRGFNWKLALVLIMGVVILGTSAYVLRKWHRSRRAEQGLVLGNKAFEQQKWQEAASQLGRYVGMVQDDVPVLLKYAEAQLNIRPFKQGNLAQAISTYRIALRIEPDNADVAIKLTEIYLQMETPNEAELIARRTLAESQSAELRRLLAISLIGQRKFSEAAKELTDIITKYPDKITAYEILGQLAEQRPELFSESAEHWFQQAVEKNPSSAMAYIIRGSFNFRHANTNFAVVDLDKAQTLNLSDSKARLRLANEYIQINELEKAKQQLIVLQDSDPQDQNLWQSWANLAIKSGTESFMLQIAKDGLDALSAQPWDFMPLAAQLFLGAGQLDLAGECIAKLKDKDIDPVSTMFLEGLLAERQGRDYDAVKLWRKSIQMGNNAPHVRTMLATALWRLGDRQSAMLELRTLISLRPDFLEGRLSFAQALALNGDWQGAAEQAQIVLQAAPGRVQALLLIIQSQIKILGASENAKDDPIWDSLKDQLIAIEKNTDNPADIKLLRVDLLTAQNNFTDAQNLLTEIKRDYPIQPKVLLAEAGCLVAQNKKEQAVSVLNQAIKQFPKEVELVKYLAIILAENGDTQNSEKTVKDAIVRIKEPSEQKKLSLLLSELYKNWGQQEKAYQLISSIVDQYPDDISVKCQLLNCKQSYEDTQKAEQIIAEIKSIQEDGWQWRYEQARLWFEKENFKHYYPEIIVMMKENLLANPDDQASRILLAASYEKAGEMPLAISVYREAINRSPRDIRIIIPMVNALYKANEYGQADEILRQATEEKLFHPDLQKLELYSYFKRGELNSASNIMDDMLAQDPNNSSLCLSLALLKIRQNDFIEAEKLLDSLTEQEPDSLPVTAARVELNIRQNKTDEAIELCNKALREHQNVSAFLLRGRTYTAAGQMEKAEADFEQASSLDPNNMVVWITKSDFYRNKNDFQKAVSCIRKAISIQPDDLEISKRAISLLLSSNNPEIKNEQKMLLDRALSLNPDDYILLTYKARHLLAEATAPNIQQATDILQKIMIEYPQYVEPWILLGAVALEQDQPAKAIDISLRGLVYSPKNKSLLKLKARAEAMRSPVLAIPTLKALLESEPNDIDTVVLLAETYINAAEHEKAIILLEKYLENLHDSSNERKMNMTLATALYKDGKKADAQRKFDQLYQSYPDDPAVLLTQVNVLKEEQNWEMIYKTVINFCDTHKQKDVIIVLIANELASGSSKKADEIAEKLLRGSLDRDPKNISAMTSMAMLLQKTGRSDDAAQIYPKILNLQPKNTVVMNNLAWILQENRKYQQALELAQRGLTITPDYVDLIDTRGMIYYKIEEYEKAMQDFTRAIELYPQNAPARASAYLHMAKASIKLGRKNDAKQSLERALQSHRKSASLSTAEYNEAQNLLKEIYK